MIYSTVSVTESAPVRKYAIFQILGNIRCGQTFYAIKSSVDRPVCARHDFLVHQTMNANGFDYHMIYSPETDRQVKHCS